MILRCGTFDYVATVPADMATSPGPLTTHDDVTPTGDSRLDDRLVGLTPTLVIADAGSTPNPGHSKGVWRPNVPRSRITLEASSRKRATVCAVSFHVDRYSTAALRPGDLLHIAGTPCGGLGMSVIRDNDLFYAAGAVTAVPLVNVEARVLFDLTDLVQAPLQERDPEFELPEVPLEISTGSKRHVLLQGRRTLGRHEISVMHGFYKGKPGADECAFISRDDAPDTAAAASAQLLDPDGVEITQWEETARSRLVQWSLKRAMMFRRSRSLRSKS